MAPSPRRREAGELGEEGIPRSNGIDENQVRRLGLKANRTLDPAAIAAIVGSYLDQLPLDFLQVGMFKALISDLVRDPELREEVFNYYTYLKNKKKA